MSWPTVELKCISKVQAGQSAPKKEFFSRTGVPFIRAGSLESLLLGKCESDLELIKRDDVKKLKMKIYPKGTIVFAKSGMSATLGRIYQLKGECCVVSHLATVVVSEKVSSDFLKFWFIANPPMRLINDPAYPSIRASDLEDLKIPLPPLETQKQIAAVLEKADQLRKDCKLLEQELNSLAQSVFIEMFGDLRIKGRYTKKVFFSEIFNISSKLVDPKLEQYEDMPHIGPEHIEKITGKILPYKTAKEDGLISGKFHFKQGCVLFSKIRPNLKKVAIPNFDGLCSADMYPLEPIGGVSTKEFIWGLILSLTFDEYLQVLASRANIPKINRKELSLFDFYLPSFSDQKEYSNQLIQIQQQIDINRELMKEVSNNFNALMQKAFNGELNLDNANT